MMTANELERLELAADGGAPVDEGDAELLEGEDELLDPLVEVTMEDDPLVTAPEEEAAEVEPVVVTVETEPVVVVTVITELAERVGVEVAAIDPVDRVPV